MLKYIIMDSKSSCNGLVSFSVFSNNDIFVFEDFNENTNNIPFSSPLKRKRIYDRVNKLFINNLNSNDNILKEKKSPNTLSSNIIKKEDKENPQKKSEIRKR